MKLTIAQRLRFSEIKKDKWLASVGKLPEKDKGWLNRREYLFIIYRTIRFIALFPFIIVRTIVNIAKVIKEFEQLHFLPLRRVHRGMDCVVDCQTWLVNGHNIYLGDFVKISVFTSIIAGNTSTIRIGTNTIIASDVTIVAMNHGMNISDGPIRYQQWKESSILIGDDVWIGANVVILPGSTIGDGSIIGAGAIVKGIIPPMTISYFKNGRLISVPRE